MGAENNIRVKTIKEKIEVQGPYYLNNFFMRVPVFSHGVWVFQKLEGMNIFPGFGRDIPFRDFYPSDPLRSKGENRHSQLFWSLTPGRVF